MSEPTPYVLGSDDPEIARLDGQASSIAGTTDALLRAAGIGGPMRVLDLRTGLGHVAFLVADLLGGCWLDSVRFEDIHEQVFYGRDVDAALALVRGFQDTRAALASLSDGEAARTVERLREMLAAHHSDECGVPSIRVPG